MTRNDEVRFPVSPEAWYRQFWPWFVFGLPALAVAAGIVTVILALRYPVEVLEQDKGTSSTDLGTATSGLQIAPPAVNLI